MDFAINTHLDDEDESTKPQLTELNVGAQFKNNMWGMSLKTVDLFSKLRFTYSQLLSNSLEFATTADYGINTNVQNFAVGAKYRYQ